ncbi:MAG: ribonuclease HII [Panacagrimonas sp.]
MLQSIPISAPSASTLWGVAGFDEVGRGCLAGPVFAAAVVLPPGAIIDGLNDSKKLTAAQRMDVAERLRIAAVAYAISRAEPEEIDRLNILQASFLAMRRALAALNARPGDCWVDGNQNPKLGLPTRLIVGGDGIEPCIMAASVLAKVARDQEMERLSIQYPDYGFAQHKGYGTRAHLAALRRFGISPLHRLSFAPCAEAAARGSSMSGRQDVAP